MIIEQPLPPFHHPWPSKTISPSLAFQNKVFGRWKLISMRKVTSSAETRRTDQLIAIEQPLKVKRKRPLDSGNESLTLRVVTSRYEL